MRYLRSECFLGLEALSLVLVGVDLLLLQEDHVVQKLELLLFLECFGLFSQLGVEGGHDVRGGDGSLALFGIL